MNCSSTFDLFSGYLLSYQERTGQAGLEWNMFIWDFGIWNWVNILESFLECSSDIIKLYFNLCNFIRGGK